MSYRAYARAEALALGIGGHAVNRSDGTVSVVAEGSEDNLDLFEDKLWTGPPAARVDDVWIEEEEALDEPLVPEFMIG